jgi:hypothetical protein
VATQSLKDVVLTEPQKIWIEYVYKNGSKMNELDIFREISDRLPEDFDAFRDLRHFWQHDHLTIFGLYKQNKEDKIFQILDNVLITLKEAFTRDRGRTSMGVKEISEVCKMPLDAIASVFDSTYLWEFWIDNSNSWERLDFDSQTNERVYKMDFYKALSRLKKYQDVDTQIELRWQKETGPIGGLHSIQPFPNEAIGIVGGLFDDAPETISSGKPEIVDSSDEVPNFSLLFEPEMTELLERRWAECKGCVDGSLPLAGIVMMGGMLESVFYAKIDSLPDKSRISDAATSPKDKDDKVRELQFWSLKSYLAVGHELGWISAMTFEFADILRDYRNLIHPQKEHVNKTKIGVSDGKLMWQLTKEIIRQLVA